MVIIENNYNKDNLGRTVFEVLGWDFGLELNEITRNTNDEDTLGGWVLTAGCSDTLKESLPPMTFFTTDIATTRLAIDALVAPCCD